jgi:nucleoside-diphosphate-sugar epimerase
MISYALHSEHISEGTYNVGSDESTVSKLELAERVTVLTPLEILIDHFEKDRDGRTYRVKFEKLKQTRFQMGQTLDAGLRETLAFIRDRRGSDSSGRAHWDITTATPAPRSFGSS